MKLLDQVRDTRFYGVTVDESTDVSMTGHLVVFAIFVEECLPQCVFLGLLHIDDGKKDVGIIFESLTKSKEKKKKK